MADRVLVFGWIAFDPGRLDDFLAVARIAAVATRREAGCLSACYAIDMDTPGRLLLQEAYADWPALRRHLASSHIARFTREAGGCGMTLIDVKAVEGQRTFQLLGADQGGPPGSVPRLPAG